jgi:hypothetical protein
MSGFLTGIVAIVDSAGNRVDTPNADGDHAPVELRLGSTLSATKTTNGSLTRVTIDVVGGGGGGAPQVVNIFTEGDKTFNGDGSDEAVQIYPITILYTGQDGDATYNFDATGVEEGWMVLFDIEGTDATLMIQNQGDDLVELDMSKNSTQVTGIYFDGDDWRPLQIRFQVS